jgi:dipeptidyl aminopeptidase/acylaminoacyl peptidase
LLTPGGGDKAAFGGGRFTQDGRAVLTTTDRGTEFRRMARIELDSGALRPLAPEIPWDVEEFDLSPDGRTLAFFANEDGVSVLHVVDLRRGREVRTARIPTGVASGLRWHPDRREIGFSLSSARSPNDVYSVDLRADEHRWTESETGVSGPAFAEPNRSAGELRRCDCPISLPS